MTELTLGIAIAGGIVGVGALLIFRDRVDYIGWRGLKLRPPAPSQAAHLETMLASEQRQRDHEAQIVAQHAQTDAKNQKTIESLTASYAAKDKTIAELRAEVARLTPKSEPPRPVGGRFKDADESKTDDKHTNV